VSVAAATDAAHSPPQSRSTSPTSALPELLSEAIAFSRSGAHFRAAGRSRGVQLFTLSKPQHVVEIDAVAAFEMLKAFHEAL